MKTDIGDVYENVKKNADLFKMEPKVRLLRENIFVNSRKHLPARQECKQEQLLDFHGKTQEFYIV